MPKAPWTIIPYTKQEDETILNIINTRPDGMSAKKAVQKDIDLLPGRSLEGVLYRYYQRLKNKVDLNAARESAEERKAARLAKLDKKKVSRAGAVIEQWTPEEDAILWNTVQMELQRQDAQGNTITLRDALRHAVGELEGRTFSSIINRYYMLRNKFGETPESYQPPTRQAEPAPQEQLSFETAPEPQRVFVPYAGEREQPRQPPAPQPYVPPQPTPPQAPPIPYQQPPQAPATPEPGPLVTRAEEFIRELFGVVEHNAALREEVKTLRSDSGTVEQLRVELEAERAKSARLQKKIYEMEEDQAHFLKLMEKARQIGRAESGV